MGPATRSAAWSDGSGTKMIVSTKRNLIIARWKARSSRLRFYSDCSAPGEKCALGGRRRALRNPERETCANALPERQIGTRKWPEMLETGRQLDAPGVRP